MTIFFRLSYFAYFSIALCWEAGYKCFMSIMGCIEQQDIKVLRDRARRIGNLVSDLVRIQGLVKVYDLDDPYAEEAIQGQLRPVKQDIVCFADDLGFSVSCVLNRDFILAVFKIADHIGGPAGHEIRKANAELILALKERHEALVKQNGRAAQSFGLARPSPSP